MFPRLSDIKRRNKHFNSIWCLENKKIIQPPLETLVTDLLGNYSCAWQNIFTNWGQIKILPASSLQSFPKHFGKILFVAARALKIIRVGRNIWYLHCGSQFDAIFSQYLWLWKFAQCLQSVPFYLVLICSPVTQQLVLIATFLFVTNFSNKLYQTCVAVRDLDLSIWSEPLNFKGEKIWEVWDCIWQTLLSLLRPWNLARICWMRFENHFNTKLVFCKIVQT